MTKDEIIAMAKEAGFNWPEILTTTIEERLERFYNLAYTKGVQDERKACAELTDNCDPRAKRRGIAAVKEVTCEWKFEISQAHRASIQPRRTVG